MLRSRPWAGLIVLLVAATLSPAGGTASTDSTAPVAQPCGTRAGPPPVWRHVVWIVMENKSFAQVIGSANAPYLGRLARRCGIATDFHSVGRPSLPNYIALTSGSTQGISDDDPPAAHRLAVPSIFSQLGTTWSALAESMPSNCGLADAGLYAVRHNPATYFTSIRRACLRRSRPLTQPPDLSARFTFITPNLCHDMHACPATGDDTEAQTRAGDDWLAVFLPTLLGTTQYRSGSTAIFVVWDEPDTAVSDSTPVPFVVVSPTTRPGTRGRAVYDDYSLLRTTEDMLGLHRHLGKAAHARNMRSAFHL